MSNYAEDIANQHAEGTAKAKVTRNYQQKAVDRISALLALAEDAAKRGDEGERDRALAKASALQMQYAVEDTMLRQKENRAAEEIVMGEFLRGESNTPLIKAKRDLLCAVAHNNRGKPVLCSAWDPEKNKLNRRAFMQVFAHESDLQFIRMLYTSLLLQMQTMMERDEKALPGKPANGWRVSYAYAFARRVNSRLWELQLANERQSATPGTALVLRDREALVAQHLTELYGKLRATKTNRKNDHNVEGSRAGREAANRADLGGKKVASANQKLLDS